MNRSSPPGIPFLFLAFVWLLLAACQEELWRGTTNMDVSRSSVTLGASTVVANMGGANHVMVEVLNEHGRGLSGKTVILAMTGSGNTVVQPAALTDGAGHAMGSVESSVAELKMLTVTVDGDVLAQNMPIEFIGDANNLSPVLSTADLTLPGPFVADGIQRAQVEIVIRDVFGNPVPDQIVDVGSTGSANSWIAPGGPTPSDGTVQARVSTTVAESKVVFVRINPGPDELLLATPPTAVFVGDANNVDPDLSSFQADPASGVVADGVQLSTLTVTVRDINNNVVPSVPVALFATGSGNTVTNPVGGSDSNGHSVGTLASTIAEMKLVSVVLHPGSGQVLINQSVAVTFVPDWEAISQSLSSVSATPLNNLIADGVQTSAITVVIRDAFGNPVEGQSVQFMVDGTGNTITQPAAISNAAGLATGSVASTVAENKVLSVVVNPGPQQVTLDTTPTLTFIGDASHLSPGLSSLQATPSTGLIADGVDLSTLVATVRDVNGNVVAGQNVLLASTGSNNVWVQPAAATGALGTASGTLATTMAQLKTVSAIINPGAGQVAITGTRTVDFAGDPSSIDIAASTLVAIPNSNVIADGVQSSTVTVTLVDGNGNPVAGQIVVLSASGLGHTWTQPAAHSDLSGQAVGGLVSIIAETKILTATINPGPGQLILSANPSVIFVPDSGQPDALRSTASTSPTTGVPTDGVTSSLLTVTVRDPMGNAIPGITVQFASTGTGNALTQPAAVTDASGQTTASIASTKAELKQLTITLDPAGNPVVLQQTPTVEFIGDEDNLSASLSTSFATPASGVVADGVDSTVLSVFVRDGNGNGVSGQSVQLALSGSNNVITQPAGVTDASGFIGGSVVSTTAEEKTVTVTVNPAGTPLVLDQTPLVTFIGDASQLSASNSSVVANPASNVPADGNSLSTISVVLRDGNSNALPGLAVSLSASGAGHTIIGPVGVTNAAGEISAQIHSTSAETKVVTVKGDPGGLNITLSDQPSITFVPPGTIISDTLSTLQVSTSGGLRADGLESSTITIVVNDASGNPVPGQTVNVQSTGAGAGITQPVAGTAADGSATATLVSSSMGAHTLSATVNPGPDSVAIIATQTVEFGYALSNTYYVRTSGTDPGSCTDGRSPATAWATLAQAAGCVAAGDTVYVGAGTHLGPLLVTTSGTPGSPIRFIADAQGLHTGDAGDVILDGAGTNESVFIDGADHVHIIGFTITGSSDLVANSAGIRVEGHFAVLRDNVLYDNSAGVLVSGADDVSIEGNSISNSAGTNPNGFTLAGSDRCTLRNNLIYNNAGHGISVAGGSANAAFENNTIYLNGLDGIWIGGDGNAAVATDNLIVDNVDDGFELTVGSTLTNTYNDVFGSGDLDYVGLVAGTGDITLDPAFVDPNGVDDLLGGVNAGDDSFHLDPGGPSPGIDAGSAAATTRGLVEGDLLADRTTRVDEVLDGVGTDGATLNLGFHGRVTHATLPDLDPSDGYLIYGAGDNRRVTVRSWDASLDSLGAAGYSPPAGAALRWVRCAASPHGTGEAFVMTLSDDGASTRLQMMRWTGTGWIRDWTASAMASANSHHRAFDLAYETSSGQLLAVYSAGDETPVYRTYLAGEWSAEVALPLNDAGGANPDPNTGNLFWTELKSHPNSDAVALAYVDQAQTLVALLWDGSAWDTSTVSALEGSVAALASGEVDNRAFDLAWEHTSGDLIVAWGREANGSFFSASLPAGSSTWSVAAQVPGTVTGEVHFLDMASEVGSDRIACGFMHTGPGTETLGAATWDGSAWVNAAEMDAQVQDAEGAIPGDFPLSVCWSGSTGSAICVYADDQSAAINWLSWTSSNGWELRGDIPWPAIALTQSVALAYTSAGLLALISDSTDALFFATHGIAGWTLQNAGNEIESALSESATKPFAAIAGQ